MVRKGPLKRCQGADGMGRLTGVEMGDREGGARAPDGGGVRTRGTRGQHSPLDGEGGPSRRGMPDSCEGGVSKGDPPAGVWSRRLGDRALVTVNPGWGPGLGADRSAVLSTRARGGPVGGPGVGCNTRAAGSGRLSSPWEGYRGWHVGDGRAGRRTPSSKMPGRRHPAWLRQAYSVSCPGKTSVGPL